MDDDVLRIWGGSYHDYWFTQDAMLKVRLVSRAITILGIVVLALLTAFLGIVGVIIGAGVAVLIYLLSGNLAKRKRDDIGRFSVEEAKDRGLVTLIVPYTVISEAELRGNRLTLTVEGRRIRVKVAQDHRERLRSLLAGKLGRNFSFSD